MLKRKAKKYINVQINFRLLLTNAIHETYRRLPSGNRTRRAIGVRRWLHCVNVDRLREIRRFACPSAAHADRDRAPDLRME